MNRRTFALALLAAGSVARAPVRADEPRRSRTVEGHAFRELAFTDHDGHLVVLYELD